jgi:hypothetical protein
MRPEAVAEAVDSATERQLDLLRAILARPEFQPPGQNPLDSLLDPVRGALRVALTLVRALALEMWRWLERLLPGGLGVDSKLPIQAGALLAIVVVVIAVILVARLARGTMATEAELREAMASEDGRAEAELARAQALAMAGDLRAALHHRYLAVLRRLDERGLLPYDRSLTNRELVPRAASPSLGAALASLVGEFDRLWYGQAACSPDEYAHFAGLADRAWQAAG